jgi:ATP-dependent RNA helicase HelY
MPVMNARPPEIPPHKLISALRGYNLLPAIVFMPTRRKCDEAASEVAADRSQPTDPDKFQRRNEIFTEYLKENPEVSTHKHAKILVNSGVASHHAGHIPAWKLLVEKMMSAGLLNAIFATSTVAAGVDFPARTVVVSNADTRGNDGWRPLHASELQQMTGRAGRRGKDNVGFVLLAPGQFQNPKKIAELLKAPPDPLESQFRSTYTSLLNLLDAFKNFAQVREIAEKSFAFRNTARQIDKLKAEADRRIKTIETKLDFGLTLNDVRGFERLVSARNRLDEKPTTTRAELRSTWLRENVQSGRIVTQGRSGKRFFLVFNVHGDKVSAMRDDGEGTNFPLDRVNRVYKNFYALKGDSVEQAFFDTIEGKNKPLTEPKLANKKTDSDDAVTLINTLIEKLLPENLDAAARTDAQNILWETWADAEWLERHARDIDFLRSDIWLPFERRAKVLDHFGYVDFRAELVTESGKWLADLRVDRPLLVGEALRQGVFDLSDPKIVGGLMASLAADSDRNYGELYLSDQLMDVINEFEEIIYAVSNAEWKMGIEPAEEINMSAAAAAERWAGGMTWNDLVSRTQAEEGDLVRLLSRTGEALIQISQLRDSNPTAAAIARETADIILREPVR